MENLDVLVNKLYPRIFRRLSRSSYFPTIHVLLFVFVASLLGFTRYQQINDLDRVSYSLGTISYLQILLWSVIQFAHIGFVYWHSGARYGKRETVIKEELLDTAQEYRLSRDEVVQLHERLSQQVLYRSLQFQRLWTISKILFLLWFGTFVLGILYPRTYIVGPNAISSQVYFDALFMVSWSLSIASIIAFLPFQRLFRKTESLKPQQYKNLDYGQTPSPPKTDLL